MLDAYFQQLAKWEVKIMRIGFTGTQQGMTIDQKTEFLHRITIFDMAEFHHGDCIGADSQAHDMVRLFPKCSIHIHPPINKIKSAHKKGDIVHKEEEYLHRNRSIVFHTDILIATPKEATEQLRSGTWATIRYAKRTHKTCLIIFPDGSVQHV